MLQLVDVSRWQAEASNPLDLAKAKAAGYSIANVALTGGKGYVSGPWAKTYLDRAAALGLGRSTYHWLDGITSGGAQAKVQIARMRNLLGSGLGGFGHCVDIEESGASGITPPKWQHVYDYVNAVQDALGRHMAIYSADWWWKPKGWPGSTLTPYVMGAPNGGYLAAAPAADSPHWLAGWGGWSDFAILQWGVRPLPGTSDCSLSVIRDPSVWADMTGEDTMTPAQMAELKKHITDTIAAKVPTAAQVVETLMQRRVFVPYADPKDPTRPVEVILGWGSPSASWHQETYRLIGQLAAAELKDDAEKAKILARIEAHVSGVPDVPPAPPVPPAVK
jgi:hypothetical protein